MSADDPAISFPDLPRGRLEVTIAELLVHAQDVLAAQGRLRALVRAHHAVVQGLELSVVLRHIVESAVELLDARYGALGVIAPDGSLAEFIHVGMDEGAVARIGHLPEGHGVLGALIDDPQPIRLARVDDDARSAGFPAGHPPMSSFLGVPIRVRDEVFGNLYLTESRHGSFSEEDEELATSLATTAGFVIENARLFDEARRREQWTAASAAVTRSMLADAPAESSLGLLVESVLALTDADLVCLMSSRDTGPTLSVDVARGIDADEIEGRELDGTGTLAAAVMASREPALAADAHGASTITGRELGSMLAVPLVIDGRCESALVVGRLAGRGRFSTDALALAAEFGAQASVALELSRARRAEQQLALVEDRGRIARDLHDHVIQQLFGTGLDIQRVAASLGDEHSAQRLVESVGSLDAVIAQIRTVIFALTPRAPGRESIRHRILDIANEIGGRMTAPPTTAFRGPVDLVARDELAEDVVAVTRETLTNIVKHARARSASVLLSVDDRVLELHVEDDGIGIRSERRSGLDNIRRRAEARGGELEVSSGADGTRLLWRVPLDDPGADS